VRSVTGYLPRYLDLEAISLRRLHALVIFSLVITTLDDYEKTTTKKVLAAGFQDKHATKQPLFVVQTSLYIADT
jgi:hypothetical protein